MTRRYRKLALWGAAFAGLIALGAATAAFTAGAAPFGAQATTTIVSTVTTGSTTVVTTITTTTPDSTSTGTTGSSSTASTATDCTGTDGDRRAAVGAPTRYACEEGPARARPPSASPCAAVASRRHEPCRLRPCQARRGLRLAAREACAARPAEVRPQRHAARVP